MLLMHVARPAKSKNSCNITIISQVDTRVKGPQWLLSFITEEGGGFGNDIVVLRQEDLVRELKACGDLEDILNSGDNENCKATLDDFDLLAVLGRGGFGKVMQVRHRPTDTVYAMKVLKKSELRRRRQGMQMSLFRRFIISCRDASGKNSHRENDLGERSPSFHCLSALRLPEFPETVYGHGFRAG